MIKIEIGVRQIEKLSEHKKIRFGGKKGQPEVEIRLNEYIRIICVDELELKERMKATPKNEQN